MLRKRLLRSDRNYPQVSTPRPNHPHLRGIKQEHPPIGFLTPNASNPSGLPFSLRHAFSFSIYWNSVTTFRKQLDTHPISSTIQEDGGG